MRMHLGAAVLVVTFACCFQEQIALLVLGDVMPLAIIVENIG